MEKGVGENCHSHCITMRGETVLKMEPTKKAKQKPGNRGKLALLDEPGRSPEKDMPENKPKLYTFQLSEPQNIPLIVKSV